LTGKTRIFVNGKGVDVAAGATIAQALESFDPAEAALVRAGDKSVTDSRGLPADPQSIVFSGAIFRLVRARAAGDELTDN
jgi:hypothetical protein